MVNRILLLEDNLVEARILQEYIKDIRNLTVSLEHSQSIADFKSKVEKNDFDLFYLRNKSLLFDLKIIFMTIPSVLKRKGISH